MKKILFFLFTLLIFPITTSALTNDLNTFDPPTRDDNLAKMDYAKGLGTFFGTNSSAIMATATEDGGFIVLVTVDGSNECPASEQQDFKDLPMTTKSNSKTSNKWKEVVSIYGGCPFIIKFNASGEEIWRSKVLTYATNKKEDGSYDTEVLSDGYIYRMEEVDSNIVLVSNKAYFIIDSSNGKFKSVPKSYCFTNSYPGEGVTPIQDNCQVITESFADYGGYSGTFNTFSDDNKFITFLNKDEKRYIASIDFVKETVNFEVDLLNYFNSNFPGEWGSDYDSWEDYFRYIYPNIYNTVDGYLLSFENDAKLYHMSDDLKTIKLLLDDKERYYIGYRNLYINNTGIFLLGNYYFNDDEIPDDNKTQTGWTISSHGNAIFNKDGTRLAVIPHDWNKDVEDKGIITSYRNELCFDYVYGGHAFKNNRWLFYGGYEEENEDKFFNVSEGMWLFDSNKNVFDYVSGYFEEYDNESYESKYINFLYGEESDYIQLKDGSIVLVGNMYKDSEEDEKEIWFEPGKTIKFTCSSGESSCQNAVIVRYNTNHNKININNNTGGNINVSVKYDDVLQGTKVIVTATPKGGYVLKKINVVSADGGEVIPLSNDNSFIMPGYDVNISAEYDFVLVNPATGGIISIVVIIFGIIFSVLFISLKRKKINL